MREFKSYLEAEKFWCASLATSPEFITKNTYERFGIGFMLSNPSDNQNGRSNYTYASKFFDWLISGEKEISKDLLKENPWVKRFVDTTGLPENFSASYGWKIKEGITELFEELSRNKESRRGYLQILQPEDNIIRKTKTTHEYPCTIGLHFFIRDGKLHLMVNMRSNNIYSVMPYDVYNFTMLQIYIATLLELPVGNYYHQINSAHMYKGDVQRWNLST